MHWRACCCPGRRPSRGKFGRTVLCLLTLTGPPDDPDRRHPGAAKVGSAGLDDDVPSSRLGASAEALPVVDADSGDPDHSRSMRVHDQEQIVVPPEVRSVPARITEVAWWAHRRAVAGERTLARPQRLALIRRTDHDRDGGIGGVFDGARGYPFPPDLFTVALNPPPIMVHAPKPQ